MIRKNQVQIKLGQPLERLYPTFHNGPGRRLIFWVQGCRFRCTETCINPALLSPDAGYTYACQDVTEGILDSIRKSPFEVKGVTVLGGEPFEQAAELSEVLTPLKAHSLTIMVYSGHTHKWLLKQRSKGIINLLTLTDLLVDGPYLPDKYDPTLAWRGSTNQNLLCLSDAYTPESLDAYFKEQGKGFNVFYQAGKELSFSGLQNLDVVKQVENRLHS